MTDVSLPTGGPGFKSRRGGLIAFGAIQIAFGLLCALMLVLMGIGLAAAAAMGGQPGAPAMDTRMMMPGFLFYLLLAVWNLWMGIGSIMARRWARALVLVMSWVWFVMGTVGMIFLLAWMPDMFDRMAAVGQMPPAAVQVATVVTFVFAALFYTVIPGLFVLFYGSPHVKATCDRIDPRPRWTDRCPLPVLALSVMAAIWAACMPLMGFYGWCIPFFGTILTGAGGAAFALLAAVLLAFLARGLYRLNLAAWWGTAALSVVWAASVAVTFSRIDMMKYYEKMNFPAEQMEALRVMPMMQNSSWIAWAIAGWVIAGLGYMVWTLRYFKSRG